MREDEPAGCELALGVGQVDDIGGECRGVGSDRVGAGTSVSRTSERTRTSRRAVSTFAKSAPWFPRQRSRVHPSKVCRRGCFVRRARRGAWEHPSMRGRIERCRTQTRPPRPSRRAPAPRESDLVRRHDARACVPDAGLVHAPGRPLAARVPGRPRGHSHARVVHAARARHGDHPAAGASAWGGRRHLLQRHRRAAQGDQVDLDIVAGVDPAWRPIRERSDLERLVDLTRDHVPYITRAVRAAGRGGSARPRSSGSPGRRSPWRPTSSRVGRRRTTSTPRP